MPNILMRRWMIAIVAAMAVGCGASPEPPPETQSPAPTVSSTLPPTLAYTPTFAPTPTFALPYGTDYERLNTPLPQPTPLPTSTVDPSWMLRPTAYVGPVPFGARHVFGLGPTEMHLSPDGRHYAITDWYGTRVYDGYTLEPLWDWPQPGVQVTWMADGEHVAVDAALYRISNAELVRQADPEGYPYQWSPDGRTIISESDGQIIVQDAASGTTLLTVEPTNSQALYDRWCGEYECLEGTAFHPYFEASPTGSYLVVQQRLYRVSGGGPSAYFYASEATVWQARSGQQVATLTNLSDSIAVPLWWAMNENEMAYRPAAENGSGFGEYRGLTFADGTIRELGEYPRFETDKWWPQVDNGWDTAPQENDTYVFERDDNASCTLLNVHPQSDNNVSAAYYYAPGQTNIRWSEDGTSILANDISNKATYEWAIGSGELIATATLEDTRPYPTQAQDFHIARHEGRVAEHSNLGAATAYYGPPFADYTLSVDGEVIATFEGEPPFRMAWSPDGSRLAVGFPDHVKVIDPNTGAVITRTGSPRGLHPSHMFFDVSWSPDGTQLAGAYSSIAANEGPCEYVWDTIGSVVLWDAETGDIIDGWVAHEGGADEVAFSPDGSLLASRGRGGEIIIWEVP